MLQESRGRAGDHKIIGDTPGTDLTAQLPFDAQGLLTHLTDHLQIMQGRAAFSGMDQTRIDTLVRQLSGLIAGSVRLIDQVI